MDKILIIPVVFLCICLAALSIIFIVMNFCAIYRMAGYFGVVVVVLAHIVFTGYIIVIAKNK